MATSFPWFDDRYDMWNEQPTFETHSSSGYVSNMWPQATSFDPCPNTYDQGWGYPSFPHYREYTMQDHYEEHMSRDSFFNEQQSYHPPWTPSSSSSGMCLEDMIRQLNANTILMQESTMRYAQQCQDYELVTRKTQLEQSSICIMKLFTSKSATFESKEDVEFSESIAPQPNDDDDEDEVFMEIETSGDTTPSVEVSSNSPHLFEDNPPSLVSKLTSSIEEEIDEKIFDTPLDHILMLDFQWIYIILGIIVVYFQCHFRYHWCKKLG